MSRSESIAINVIVPGSAVSYRVNSRRKSSMLKSLMFRLFHGPHASYFDLLVVAILLAIGACLSDVFIDESESSYSDDDRERHGWKATKYNRPFFVGIFLLLAAFAIWKLWQP